MTTLLKAIGGALMLKLVLLPMFVIGYVVYLMLTSERRRKAAAEKGKGG